MPKHPRDFDDIAEGYESEECHSNDIDDWLGDCLEKCAEKLDQLDEALSEIDSTNGDALSLSILEEAVKSVLKELETLVFRLKERGIQETQ